MIVVKGKSYVLSFGRITYRKKKREKEKEKGRKRKREKMSDLPWRQGDASSRRNIKKASFWSSKCLLKVFRSRSLECESIHGHWRSPSKRTTKKGKIHRKEIFLWSVLGEEMERLVEGLVVLSLKEKKRRRTERKKFYKFSINFPYQNTYMKILPILSIDFQNFNNWSSTMFVFKNNGGRWP